MLSLPDLNPAHAVQRQTGYAMHVTEHLGAAARGLAAAARPKDDASRLDALTRTYDELDHAIEDASHIAGVGLVAGGIHATYRTVSGAVDRLNKVVPAARERRGVVEVAQGKEAFERALDLYDNGEAGYTNRARAVQYMDHSAEDARHGLDLLKASSELRDPLLDGLDTLEDTMRDARPLDESALNRVRDLYSTANSLTALE